MSKEILLGSKLFKEVRPGWFEMVRVIKEYNDELVKIKTEYNETMAGKDVDPNPRKVHTPLHDAKPTDKYPTLDRKEYTKLEPVGIMTFSIVKVGKFEDVIVTFAKMLDIKSGLTVPSVICRQSVTDFFYNILSNKEKHDYVGVSVSDRTCPSNIEYGELLACDEILYSDIVNIYYEDTIDTVLECVNTIKFDDTLRKLFDKHVEAKGNPLLKFTKISDGWCKTLKDLLVINNFWVDVDSVMQITDVDFSIADNIIIGLDKETNATFFRFTNEVTQFLSKTFQFNITDTILTRYAHDIDLAEYNNSNYVLLRDSEGSLWIMVYLTEGVYLEADYVATKEELSHKLALYIYDKYTNSK